MSACPGLTTFNTRPSNQQPGIDLGSTQAPCVQDDQSKNVMESDEIHLGHVTDDLVDTWPDSPPAGDGVGASLSY